MEFSEYLQWDWLAPFFCATLYINLLLAYARVVKKILYDYYVLGYYGILFVVINAIKTLQLTLTILFISVTLFLKGIRKEIRSTLYWLLNRRELSVH